MPSEETSEDAVEISRETLCLALGTRLKLRLRQGFIPHLQPGALGGGQNAIWKT